MRFDRGPDRTRRRSALTRLADAAMLMASGQSAGDGRAAVGVVRGLDRESRVRGELLRRKLRARGVTVVDVLAQPTSRPRAGEDSRMDLGGCAALVDATRPGAREAERLAARSGVPLVTLDGRHLDRSDIAASCVNVPVIDIDVTATGGEASHEVALNQLVIRPTQPDTCRLRLRLSSADSTVHGPSEMRDLAEGAQISICLTAVALHVVSDWPNGSRQEWTAATVTAEPTWGQHTVTRDGVPMADLQDALRARHKHRGLHRHLA